MKNQKSNRSLNKKTKATTRIDVNKTIKDEELIVIRDASNGKEYFLSVIDTFVLSKYEYVVMYNYEPDDGNHRKPELVIMRTSYGEKGDQYFYSIKDNEEINRTFEFFMRRFAASETTNPSGVKFASNTQFRTRSSQ